MAAGKRCHRRKDLQLWLSPWLIPLRILAALVFLNTLGDWVVPGASELGLGCMCELIIFTMLRLHCSTGHTLPSLSEPSA